MCMKSEQRLIDGKKEKAERGHLPKTNRIVNGKYSRNGRGLGQTVLSLRSNDKTDSILLSCFWRISPRALLPSRMREEGTSSVKAVESSISFAKRMLLNFLIMIHVRTSGFVWRVAF